MRTRKVTRGERRRVNFHPCDDTNPSPAVRIIWLSLPPTTVNFAVNVRNLLLGLRPLRVPVARPEVGKKGLSTSRPWNLSNRPGRRSRNGSPTTNRISTGSTDHGIHPIPTRTGSTKVPHGKLQKSDWTTAAFWFSNTHEKGDEPPACSPTPLRTAAEIKLGKAVWRATLEANEFHSEIFRPGQIPASCGKFLLSVLQF